MLAQTRRKNIAPESPRTAAVKLAGDATRVTNVSREGNGDDVLQYAVEHEEGRIKCAASFSVTLNAGDLASTIVLAATRIAVILYTMRRPTTLTT